MNVLFFALLAIVSLNSWAEECPEANQLLAEFNENPNQDTLLLLQYCLKGVSPSEVLSQMLPSSLEQDTNNFGLRLNANTAEQIQVCNSKVQVANEPKGYRDSEFSLWLNQMCATYGFNISLVDDQTGRFFNAVNSGDSLMFRTDLSRMGGEYDSEENGEYDPHVSMYYMAAMDVTKRLIPLVGMYMEAYGLGELKIEVKRVNPDTRSVPRPVEVQGQSLILRVYYTEIEMPPGGTFENFVLADFMNRNCKGCTLVNSVRYREIDPHIQVVTNGFDTPVIQYRQGSTSEQINEQGEKVLGSSSLSPGYFSTPSRDSAVNNMSLQYLIPGLSHIEKYLIVESGLAIRNPELMPKHSPTLTEEQFYQNLRAEVEALEAYVKQQTKK